MEWKLCKTINTPHKTTVDRENFAVKSNFAIETNRKYLTRIKNIYSAMFNE